MVGGAREAVERITPLRQRLAPAPDRGWIHCGASGAGHFAKMVQNGIEYGMMQALAEGLALLDAKKEFGFDVAQIAQAWRDGTQLAGVAPQVADSGERRWTAQEAIDLAVPAPVITLALMMRFASRGRDDCANRLLAPMRHAFAGHPVAPAPTG